MRFRVDCCVCGKTKKAAEGIAEKIIGSHVSVTVKQNVAMCASCREALTDTAMKAVTEKIHDLHEL